ncbi:DUF6941 family protein [Paenibacillus sp. FSL L8-0708]|uniref:DUF6941 family protein n=1 Tax=Paenibacillus sp. FSL L8-0708 TaxID=2975311 RepID=UPI0030FA552F
MGAIKPIIKFVVFCQQITENNLEGIGITSHLIEPFLFLKIPLLPKKMSFAISIGISVFDNSEYELKLEFISPDSGDKFEMAGKIVFPKLSKEGGSLLSIEITDYEFRDSGEYILKLYINGELLNTQSLNVYTVEEDGNV